VFGKARQLGTAQLGSSPFFEPGCLADSVSQEIQFRSPHGARPLNDYVFHTRRMQREFSFHALASHDPADRKHLSTTTTTPSDDRSRENLDAFLLTFENLGVDFYQVPNFKFGNFRL
jgi:hypothetical protein